MRFEVLTAVKMFTVIFRVVPPRGHLGGYQRFKRNDLTLKMETLRSPKSLLTTHETV